MAELVRMRQEAVAYHVAHIMGRGRWGISRGVRYYFLQGK